MAAGGSWSAASRIPARACAAGVWRIRTASFRYNLHFFLQDCQHNAGAVSGVRCDCSRTYGSGDGDQRAEHGIRATAAMYHIRFFSHVNFARLFNAFPSSDQARIIVAPENSSVEEGGTLNFFCRGDGNPLPVVRWLVNGRTPTSSRCFDVEQAKT